MNNNVISSARLRSCIHIPNIAHKTQIKYQGINIDHNLNCGPRILHLNNKLAKDIAIIYKLRYFVYLHALRQLYYSFIYPCLSYAIITWGSACKISLRRMNVCEACALPVAEIMLHHITIS